ncbi:MAG: NUDIX hydrolase [Nitriliruptoraceae bacterium]
MPVQDAVTVIVVRDPPGTSADPAAPADPAADLGPAIPAGRGVEVLLLERHPDSVFAPGALVFPGGKLEEQDELPASRVRLSDPGGWVARLGVADEAAARTMLVAAVRETFEECGLLLARHRDGRPVRPGSVSAEEVARTRSVLASRDGAFDWRPWLADHGLVLDLDALAMWSWWVTPVGPPRRYDTRFLVARAPVDQRATHDDVETTSLRWTSPRAALAAHAAGEIHMIFPTRRTLEQLAAFTDPEALIGAARRGEVDLRRVQPELVLVDGTPMVQHPDGGPPVPV